MHICSLCRLYVSIQPFIDLRRQENKIPAARLLTCKKKKTLISMYSLPMQANNNRPMHNSLSNSIYSWMTRDFPLPNIFLLTPEFCLHSQAPGKLQKALMFGNFEQLNIQPTRTITALLSHIIRILIILILCLTS